MKHKCKTRGFGRSTSQNKAIMRNLFRSLILKRSIQTTEAKAKELKIYTDRLLSKCQNPDYLKNKALMKWTSTDIVPKLKTLMKKYNGRLGGYVSITKVDTKRRDLASTARIKLV
jgi:large subunit ribosomal protein L17